MRPDLPLLEMETCEGVCPVRARCKTQGIASSDSLAVSRLLAPRPLQAPEVQDRRKIEAALEMRGEQRVVDPCKSQGHFGAWENVQKMSRFVQHLSRDRPHLTQQKHTFLWISLIASVNWACLGQHLANAKHSKPHAHTHTIVACYLRRMTWNCFQTQRAGQDSMDAEYVFAKRPNHALPQLS